MPKAIFRFYEELNDYLSKSKRKTDFNVEFTEGQSIKDLIEAIGVTCTRVDLILVNQNSVAFDYIVQDGDRISVYPVFESFNIETVTRLRKTPLRQIKFIADIDLGDIAEHLRASGFDIYFDPSLPTKEIIEISQRENRIILTQSRELLKSRGITRGIFVPPGTIENQIREILNYLGI